MWIIDAQTATQGGGFFQSDFWHAFLVFISMFFANKLHDATKGNGK